MISEGSFFQKQFNNRIELNNGYMHLVWRKWKQNYKGRN